MEQSVKPVDNDATTGVGESEKALTPVPILPLTPLFTKVDNNLTGIGFFTASSKRSRKAVEKTTTVIDGGVERRISILPSAKYGLPITQDQDFWLALMKLVSDHIQQSGKLQPNESFAFTSAQLTKMLGQSHSGKNYKAVQEWLAVMTSTTIEGGAYNTLKKTWIIDRTHAVERIVTMGQTLPNGTIADKHHIWFSQWQLDNINSGNLMPIELITYTQLVNNIAKNLVPHLQEWLFASQRDGRFEKQYEDICQLLGIRTYRFRSQIQEQLSPSLNELLNHGYLSKWSIDPMASRKVYKLVLWHGSKYYGDRQLRQQHLRVKNESTEEKPHRPRQARLNLRPEQPTPAQVDHKLLSELTSRGVEESVARRELSTLPPDHPTLDMLEWFDKEVARPGHTIKNTAAWLVTLIQNRSRPPVTFVSSRQSAEQQAAQEAKDQADMNRQAEADAHAEADRQQLDNAIAQMNDADRLNLRFHAEAMLSQEKEYWYLKAKETGRKDTLENVITARMRKLLKARLQTEPVTEPITIESNPPIAAVETVPSQPTQPPAPITTPESQISAAEAIVETTAVEVVEPPSTSATGESKTETAPDHNPPIPSRQPLQEQPAEQAESIETHLL